MKPYTSDRIYTGRFVNLRVDEIDRKLLLAMVKKFATTAVR